MLPKRDPSYPLFAARLFALIALWFVPISTALTNTSMVLFGLAALLAPEVWHHWQRVIRHRVSLAAILLMLALSLSLLYSVAPFAEGLSWLAKYRKLLFIPLLLIVFEQAELQNVARWGLFISLVFVLILSTTNNFGLTAIGPLHDEMQLVTRAWVFKKHITAGLFSALLFNMSADMAATVNHRGAKAVFYGLALLAFANVFVMLAGRTGQIVAACLLAYQAVRFFRRNCRDATRVGITLRLFACALPWVLLISVSFQMKNSRLTQIGTEISDYQRYNKATSVGLRLEWYRKSLELFAKRPIFGYGLASVQQEFKLLTQQHTGTRIGEIREQADEPANAQTTVTANPHSQYLLLAVELGLIGVVLFINLLGQVARAAMQLPAPSGQLVGAYLFAFMVGCLANSLLLDFSEGYLFVLISGIFCCGAKTGRKNP